MGTHFFWFYDVIIVAIIASCLYIGSKKGFVRTILSFAAIILSFIIALNLSSLVADMVYDKYITKDVKEMLEAKIDSVLSEMHTSELSYVDVSKIYLGDKPISEVDLTPNDAGKITLDLTRIDLSKVNTSYTDLSIFGITDEDLASVNAGKVEINEAELTNKSIERIVFIEALAAHVKSTPLYTSFLSAADIVNEKFPSLAAGKASKLSDGSNKVLTDILYDVIYIDGKVSDIVLQALTGAMIPIRIIILFILFVICLTILRIIINRLSLVDKIPLVGPANSLLGGILGIVQAVVYISIICIVLQLIIYITNNSIIFLNEATISKTYIFNRFYNIGFLNF